MPGPLASIRSPITWHDLRHQFISLLIAAGKHPKYIAAQAGHSSAGFTLDRYGSLFETLPITPVEWWDDLLWSGGNQIDVNFRLQGKLAPTAARVALVGTFNGWNPRSHLLTKNLKGDWMITVHFPLRSRIVYHLEVDGVPWLDPDDDERVPNGWGSEYSVRYVGRAIGPPGTALARGPEPPRSNRGAVPPRPAGVSRSPEARQLSAGAQVLETGVTEGG